MQAQRLDTVSDVMGMARAKRLRTTLVGLVLAFTAVNAAASAPSIRINVDSSLADYLLDTVCSGNEVDAAYLRSSPLVQAQIKHHTSLSPTRNFEALRAGLEAAARCEIPENDVYRFGPIVENKARFQATVAFLKERAPQIEAFVTASLQPFTPPDLQYSGSIVLSVIGNPCGGFAADGYFYLALNCLTAGHEGEYSAIQVVSAHETFHALQHAFFWGAGTELERIDSREAAIEQLFRWLMREGTAEYVADSRQIKGSGALTGFLTGFSRNGYAQIPLYLDFLGYAAEILSAGEDYAARLENVYKLGFSGAGRQVFYYVGAAMAAHLDRVHGREALICIFRLPPEQFVRAYHAAALESPDGEARPLGTTVTAAADRISRTRDTALRFERCIE